MVTALLLAALAAQQAGVDYRAQAESWRRVVAASATDARAWSNLGVTLHLAGDDAGAIAALDRALQLDQSLASAQLFKGLALTRTGKPAAALPCLERAARLDTRGSLPALGLARAHVALGDFSQANDAYFEATRRDPASSEAWYGLGITYKTLLAAAARRLAAAAGDPSAAAGTEGAPTRAGFEAARKAADAPALARFARACRGLAVEALSMAVSLDPGSVQAHLILAESFRDSGREQEAIQEYQAALRLRPDASAPYFGLALTLWRANQPEQAEQSVRKALALSPNDPDAAALLAELLLRRGENAEALRLARLALDRGPNSHRARLTAAKLALAEGRAEEAVATIEPVLSSDPNGALHYFYSQALRRAGRTPEAEAAMARFRTLRGWAGSTGARPDSSFE